MAGYAPWCISVLSPVVPNNVIYYRSEGVELYLSAFLFRAQNVTEFGLAIENGVGKFAPFRASLGEFGHRSAVRGKTGRIRQVNNAHEFLTYLQCTVACFFIISLLFLQRLFR